MNVTVPIKFRLQTPDGRMAEVTAKSKECLKENGDTKAFRAVHAGLASFTYPVLEVTGYCLADLGDSLRKAGIMKFYHKHNFKVVGRTLSDLISRMGAYFSSVDFFREYSDAVWEDARQLLWKLNNATYITTGRVRKGKDVDVVSRLLVINQLLGLAVDSFESVFRATYDKTGLGLEEFFADLSPQPVMRACYSWLRDFKDVDVVVAALREDTSVKIGYEGFVKYFNDSERMDKWQLQAWNAMPENYHYEWKDMHQRPHGNRRVVIMDSDVETHALYRNKQLVLADGTKKAWNETDTTAWRYENEEHINVLDYKA